MSEVGGKKLVDSVGHPKWPMESSSTKVNPAPQTDGLVESTIIHHRLELSSFGFWLKRGQVLGTPLSSVFESGSFAYLRMLAGHRRRIKRDMSARQKAEISRVRHCDGAKGVKNKTLPFKIKYQDLKVVNCAGCKRTLLGESMEHIRAEAHSLRKVSASNLPPAVALRTDWGPWCHKCVREQRSK